MLPNICERPCSFSGTAGSSRITPPWASRGKGWGRGREITSLQKNTAGGLCPQWTSHWDLGETLLSAVGEGDGGMKCCFHVPGYVGLVVKDSWSCWADIFGKPTKTLFKVLGIFFPPLLSLGKDQKAKSGAKTQHRNTSASLPFVNGKLEIWKQTYCKGAARRSVNSPISVSEPPWINDLVLPILLSGRYVSGPLLTLQDGMHLGDSAATSRKCQGVHSPRSMPCSCF